MVWNGSTIHGQGGQQFIIWRGYQQFIFWGGRGGSTVHGFGAEGAAQQFMVWLVGQQFIVSESTVQGERQVNSSLSGARMGQQFMGLIGGVGQQFMIQGEGWSTVHVLREGLVNISWSRRVREGQHFKVCRRRVSTVNGSRWTIHPSLSPLHEQNHTSE